MSYASNRSARIPPRVLFLGSVIAGHRTRFLNLRAHTQTDMRIRPLYRTASSWTEHGSIERLPLVPAGLKGLLRGAQQATPFAMLPRPDAIWTSCAPLAAPYFWAQLGRLKRPLVVDLDATYDLLEPFAEAFGRRPKRRQKLRLARMLEDAVWRSAAWLTPWSNWAAEGLRRRGVPDERIMVLPPGVDLELWQPRPRPRRRAHERLRLLFVGADFRRKGGEDLLRVFQAEFAEHCVLDIVTRDAVAAGPNVQVHRAEPNSPLLRELYAAADLFVLPSRAECFGIATVEAMASGLPVITTDIGGVRDIVQPDRTGYLIAPTREELAMTLHRAMDQRQQLPEMGRYGREVAELRFDGRRNDERIVELLLTAG